MKRYDTRIDDGTLSIETETHPLEIGSMDDICELLGGETYTIEYDDTAQTAAWLRTDDDGTITFDVRETIDSIDYDDVFVEKIAAEPIDELTAHDYPVRTTEYADLMREIWDSKGTVDLE